MYICCWCWRQRRSNICFEAFYAVFWHHSVKCMQETSGQLKLWKPNPLTGPSSLLSPAERCGAIREYQHEVPFPRRPVKEDVTLRRQDAGRQATQRAEHLIRLKNMDPQGGRCDKHIDSLRLPPPTHPNPLHSAHALFYPSRSSLGVTQRSSPITSSFISLQFSLFIHSFLRLFFLLIINSRLMVFSFKFHSLFAFFFLPFKISLIAYFSLSLLLNHILTFFLAEEQCGKERQGEWIHHCWGNGFQSLRICQSLVILTLSKHL